MANAQNTYKEYGNFEVQLLPDYKYTHNGYGLCTLTANFQLDSSNACKSDAMFARGNSFPGGAGLLARQIAKQKWTCVRADESGRDGNLVIVTGTYAAISNTIQGGCTNTEATITSAVVSEPIESHPNFSKIQIEMIGSKPLGGKWAGNVPPKVDDVAKNPFRALWQQSANVSSNTISYNFLGFAPTDNTADEGANRKAGMRSWMRPSVTMRLTGYTDSKEMAINTAKKTWWVTKDGVGFLTIPDMYKQIAVDDTGFANFDVSDKKPKEKNWLITSCNTEVYGGLYKVTADLLLSGVAGWDPDVYPYMYAL